VYSLNVPVPGRVARVASDIARELPAARARARGEHTLGVKRLGTDRDVTYSRLEAKVRDLLAGQPAFELRVADVDYFTDPPTGTAPVVYLTVESPGLLALHNQLADEFEPIDGIEGDEYEPHVTVARGGRLETAKRVTERDIEPVTWTASELVFWDATHNQSVSSLSLPA
jgi:2'-5' RNA ligase